MRKIRLTRGKVALVDDRDFGYISRFKWHCLRGRFKNRTVFYAVREIRLPDKRVIQWMHRILLGLDPRDSRVTDHRDGDGLNNQRSNLRPCSVAENLHNRHVKLGKYSRYIGVSWNSEVRKWVATISILGKSTYLGLYSKEIDAARAYGRAAKRYFREFAPLNPTGARRGSPKFA